MGPLKGKATTDREAYKCYIYHDYIDRNHNIVNTFWRSQRGKKDGGV